MKHLSLRRLLPGIAIGAVVVLALGAVSALSSTDITRARLERSLPKTFANLYVQQAKILGHEGITVQSLKARAQCDKGGPNVADHGPGADWICLMQWHDPNIDATLLPGKFELNVKSNDCYTAGGPSKIVGLLTITDTHGNDVPNPVFEFDSCFNPNSSNSPTGVVIPPSPPTPTTDAGSLTVSTSGLVPDEQGRIRPALLCSAAGQGCAGTATAKLDGQSLGVQTYAVAPGKPSVVEFTLSRAQRHTGGTLTVRITPVIGTTSRTSIAVPVNAR
jgi:hypothetical protein